MGITKEAWNEIRKRETENTREREGGRWIEADVEVADGEGRLR